MKCVEEKCEGEVDVSSANSFDVMTGCRSFTPAFPCDKCGRLHWAGGDGVNNRGGDKAFCIGGRLVLR